MRRESFHRRPSWLCPHARSGANLQTTKSSHPSCKATFPYRTKAALPHATTSCRQKWMLCQAGRGGQSSLRNFAPRLVKMICPASSGACPAAHQEQLFRKVTRSRVVICWVVHGRYDRMCLADERRRKSSQVHQPARHLLPFTASPATRLLFSSALFPFSLFCWRRWCQFHQFQSLTVPRMQLWLPTTT